MRLVGFFSTHPSSSSSSFLLILFMNGSLAQLSNDEARGGRDFSLLAGFPPSDLIFDLDRTIDDCKLAGQTVTVRWKEG